MLSFAYLTGWRVGEILDLRRADLDFDAGMAILDADSTKGRRTAHVELHPAIFAKLRAIVGFHPMMFE